MHPRFQRHEPVYARAISIAAFVMSVALSGASLACSKGGADQAPARRPLDASPVKGKLSVPMSPGRAEAFFELNTGADQLTERAKEAGLVLVVRYGDDEFRQTIASCREPGLGSALGGGTERELEVALCDAEYRLISEPGQVTVIRVDGTPDGKQVTRLELPPAIRATRPAQR